MGKISNKVSQGLGATIQEVKEKMQGIESKENVESLLNSGAENHKKRSTKKEQLLVEDNSLFEAVIDKEPKKQEQRMKTYEEICQEDIQKAHDRNYEDPDFDFRNHYSKDQIVYYILVLESGINTKELKRLKVRTVYPRMMICAEENAGCQCIGYNQRDYIFNTSAEAKPVYDSINLIAEESLKASKSKSKINDDVIEEENEKAQYGPDLSLD